MNNGKNKNKNGDKKKHIKTLDPVNINCTWHWRRLWKEERKKIYTFIILKIEVPPVIIKSTVRSERLENLIMVSTASQHP